MGKRLVTVAFCKYGTGQSPFGIREIRIGTIWNHNNTHEEGDHAIKPNLIEPLTLCSLFGISGLIEVVSEKGTLSGSNSVPKNIFEENTHVRYL